MHLRSLVAAVCLLASLRPAAAAPPHPSAPPEAREHVTAANRAYNSGDFQRAAAEYQAAYELFASPPLLFNLAQCQRQLGEKQKALFLYRRFLEEAPPTHEFRADAEALAKELEASIEQERRVQKTPPTGPVAVPGASGAAPATSGESPPPSAAPLAQPAKASDQPAEPVRWSRPPLYVGIALAVVAVAGAAVGGALIAHAGSLDDQAPGASSLQGARDLTSSAGGYRAGGAAALAVGGAAVVGSAVGFALAARHPRQSASLRLAPSTHGGGLAVAGSW
jgi:tetratricopeptide (TPR) repeat protein